MEPQGLILLTDRVREIATKNLPMENFNILKQDVITKMIGEEELYRSCKEGVCIGDLARKTNANYGARCDVVKFNNSLVLKFELYSVNEDAIFETFTDYSVKDFYGMLDVLEKRLPGAFQKMIAARNMETAHSKPAAVQPKPTAPEPPPAAQRAKPSKSPPVKLTRRGAGAAAGGGGFFASDFGAGICGTAFNASDGDGDPLGEYSTTVPWMGGGVHAFFDVVYAEIGLGLSFGGGTPQMTLNGNTEKAMETTESFTSLGISVLGKYPIALADAISFFPAAGIEYALALAGETNYAGEKRKWDGDGYPKAIDFSALWFKFGVGADFVLTYAVFLRPEVLYGIRLANKYENDNDLAPPLGHGLTIKAGVGYKF